MQTYLQHPPKIRESVIDQSASKEKDRAFRTSCAELMVGVVCKRLPLGMRAKDNIA